jgi:hypothetical protein
MQACPKPRITSVALSSAQAWAQAAWSAAGPSAEVAGLLLRGDEVGDAAAIDFHAQQEAVAQRAGIFHLPGGLELHA